MSSLWLNLGRGVLASAVFISQAGFGADDAGIIQPGQEKLTFMVGAFLPAFRSKVQVDGETTGTGDRVDLGDDLGVDQSTTGGYLGAEWRFAPRHRFGFTYTRFTLRGSRQAQRDLHIDDKVYPIGASLESELRLEVIPITYSYSFVKKEDDELAATVGLHWDRLTFKVDGSLSVGPGSGSRETSVTGNIPLPLLGLRYDHNFSERWSAGASLAGFALSFGEDTTGFKGSIISARLHGEYRMTRNLGIGAALDTFKVNTKADKDNWHGGFDYYYWGPQIYLTARF
jgi:hypothetical protein